MAVYSNYGQRDSQYADGGDVGFSRLNQRLRPDQLKPGEIAVSINGRMDVDGAWQPRRGYDSVGEPIAANTEELLVTFYAYTNKTISSATRSTTTVTVTTSTAHNFVNDTIVGIAGLTGSVPANGNRRVTVTGSTTFTFTIAGATGSETYGGSGTAGSAFVTGSLITGVFGSCLFSDPSDDNAEYIILADNLAAVAIDLRDGTGTDIAYPSGVTISEPCTLVQCFNKVILFREGATALEWNGSFTGTPAFALVANGDYTQPVYLDASNNTTITDGVATVTAASHGLSVGSRVYVVDNGSTQLVEGGEGYQVSAVPTSGSFKVNAQVADSAATSVVWTKRVSSGSGLRYMPAPAWGVYHQRRLWVPYSYETSGTSGSPTITVRNVRDELLASDIGDSNTYDHIYNQLKVTHGTADYLVSVAPFAEDNLLIFNRNSIHLATGVSGSLSDIQLRLITAEVGCVARNSIVQVGNKVFFLSDNGVYSADFGDLYNLRGAGVPLSDAVDPIIKRINEDYASRAVAAFHNNRYFLAFPLDDSRVNNAVLVYNFLNEGWESLDTIESTAWDVSNLIVGGAGDINRLYAISSNGGVHAIDEREDDQDNLSLYSGVSAAAYPIVSEMTTRQYTLGTLDRKTFSSYELHIESSDTNSSNATIGCDVENPDYTGTLTTVSTLLGGNLDVSEDASLRGRIGNKRGYGIQLSVTPTAGRPKVRAVKVSATATNLATSQAT